MRYPTLLPTASREDLAAAFTSDDPLAYIDGNVATLDRVAQWVETESAKWRGIRRAIEPFDSGEQSPGSPESRDPAIEQPPAAVVPAHPDQNGAATRPKTRRQGLSMLFHEQPDRVWRTRELAQELEARGWGGPSGNESNKVSRVLSLMVSEGEIKAVGKQGRYKLRTDRPESRPQTLEEVSQ
jgi:hypothetical protein